MSEMYFDFDAYMAERTSGADDFKVKAFGKEYSIPSDIPFDLVLNMQRKQKDGKGEMDEENVQELAGMIFGKEVFDEWIENKIGLTGVMVMMERVISMYMAKANKTMTNMAQDGKNRNPR